MSIPRVAIIGGGLAGLAAAARLRSLGAEPHVLERDSEVGGMVRTRVRDGWVIDTGACMAAEPDASVRALLDQAGLGDCTLRASPGGANRYIVHHGAPVPLPRTTSEFTASPLLSLAGRLRLLKERFVPAARDTIDESVDSFARRRFGDEMAERMFDPLISSTCAGDPREILARFAFPLLVGHERKAGSGLQGSNRARMEARRRAKGKPTGSWASAGGMQQVSQRLAAWAGNVRVGTAVQAIRAANSGVSLEMAGSTEAFDAVIVAIPAPSFASMAIHLSESERLADVAAMPHTSIAAISLGFRREQVEHSLEGSRLLVPSVERRPILSAVFPSSIFPGRVPAGHVLMTAYVGGTRQPELLAGSAADLTAMVYRELAHLLGIRGDPVMSDVAVWPNALPQAVAGHDHRLAAADAVEAANHSIAFTGAWRDGLSIGEVMLGGFRAADRLVAREGWSLTT